MRKSLRILTAAAAIVAIAACNKGKGSSSSASAPAPAPDPAKAKPAYSDLVNKLVGVMLADLQNGTALVDGAKITSGQTQTVSDDVFKKLVDDKLSDSTNATVVTAEVLKDTDESIKGFASEADAASLEGTVVGSLVKTTLTEFGGNIQTDGTHADLDESLAASLGKQAIADASARSGDAITAGIGSVVDNLTSQLGDNGVKFSSVQNVLTDTVLPAVTKIDGTKVGGSATDGLSTVLGKVTDAVTDNFQKFKELKGSSDATSNALSGFVTSAVSATQNVPGVKAADIQTFSTKIGDTASKKLDVIAKNGGFNTDASAVANLSEGITSGTAASAAAILKGAKIADFTANQAQDLMSTSVTTIVTNLSVSTLITKDNFAAALAAATGGPMAQAKAFADAGGDAGALAKATASAGVDAGTKVTISGFTADPTTVANMVSVVSSAVTKKGGDSGLASADLTKVVTSAAGFGADVAAKLVAAGAAGFTNDSITQITQAGSSATQQATQAFQASHSDFDPSQAIKDGSSAGLQAAAQTVTASGGTFDPAAAAASISASVDSFKTLVAQCMGMTPPQVADKDTMTCVAPAAGGGVPVATGTATGSEPVKFELHTCDEVKTSFATSSDGDKLLFVSSFFASAPIANTPFCTGNGGCPVDAKIDSAKFFNNGTNCVFGTAPAGNPAMSGTATGTDPKTGTVSMTSTSTSTTASCPVKWSGAGDTPTCAAYAGYTDGVKSACKMTFLGTSPGGGSQFCSSVVNNACPTDPTGLSIIGGNCVFGGSTPPGTNTGTGTMAGTGTMTGTGTGMGGGFVPKACGASSTESDVQTFNGMAPGPGAVFCTGATSASSCTPYGSMTPSSVVLTYSAGNSSCQK